jgi:hypothetical protein
LIGLQVGDRDRTVARAQVYAQTESNVHGATVSSGSVQDVRR